MSSAEKEHKRISRREFVKGAAVGAAGVAAAGALASCTTAATPEVITKEVVVEKEVPVTVEVEKQVIVEKEVPVEVIKEVEVKPWLPEKWDKEADLVIVGAGGTGLAAAIEARDAGASVIVLEKMEEPGGTTKLSGGIIQASGTDLQKAEGIANDTPDAHFKYWMAASEGIADPALVKVMADNSAANIKWLESQGLKYISLSGVSPIAYITDPALMVLRIHGLEGEEPGTPGRGARMAAVLFEQAQTKGATFLFETPAASLVYDPTKGVVGVRATEGGKDIFVKAKKAVILAAGSFDFNEDMSRAFSPQQLWELETGSCACNPGNVGDGMKMAMAIGADLAGLGGTVGVPVSLAPQGAGMWVNKYGQRFVNEAGHYAYKMRAIYNQVEHMAWAIFDENARESSGADIAEAIADGKIKTGTTLRELAESIGVNAAQLEATVDKWNEDMATGEDTLLHKQVVLEPIDRPPFYATQVTSYNLGACGGVKINTHAQVIDVNGEVIPRLYAGGMVAGGFIGPYYPGSGTALNSTVTFGRIAGKTATAEQPWE